MKFIDLHTHPSTEYYSDPLEIVNEWHNLNMEKLFVCGTNEDDSTQAIELAKKLILFILLLEYIQHYQMVCKIEKF